MIKTKKTKKHTLVSPRGLYSLADAERLENADIEQPPAHIEVMRRGSTNVKEALEFEGQDVDYKLKAGYKHCWIKVGKFSIQIKRGEGSVVTEIYRYGREDLPALNTAEVYDDEC